MNKPDKGRAIARLRKLLAEIPNLRQLSLMSREFGMWNHRVGQAITRTFGETSMLWQKFKATEFSPMAIYPDMPAKVYREAYLDGLRSVEIILEASIDEIEEYWDETESNVDRPDTTSSLQSKRVFVVHGHNSAPREAVARLLEQQGLEPIVLHEQANEGRTIIEKFEDFADVRFAVVLLTPDDEGRKRDSDLELKSRARQNVVFEFGYFIGKLGRKRVCALKMNDVEQPSDCDGILYIPWDDQGAWKFSLLSELNAAGFAVDANQILSK